MGDSGHTLETLSVKVQNLETADDRMRADMHDGFNSIRSDITQLAALIQQRGQTNWTLVVAVVSVTLVGVGMISQAVINPIKDRLEVVERHSERDGHPYSMSAIDHLEKRLELMNGARDEMRDLVYKNLSDRMDRIDSNPNR